MKTINYIILPIITAILFAVCYHYSDRNDVVVPGRVISKDIIVSGRHHRHVEYKIAVRPNDSRLSGYAVSTNYLTYATHNIGDQIAFKVRKNAVDDPTYKWIYDGMIAAPLILLFVTIALSVWRNS